MDPKLCMILNGAVGDTCGAPIEMMPYQTIHRRYGKIMTEYIVNDKVKDRIFTYTDDTEMTIAVLDFLQNNKINNFNEKDYNKIMLDCYAKHYEPFRGYSAKTNDFFQNYIFTGNYIIDNKQSNGGLMRVSPIVFVCDYMDDLKIKELVKVIHYPTHMSDSALHTSYIFIKILTKFHEFYNVDDGKKQENIMNFIKNELFDLLNDDLKNKISIMIEHIDDDDEYEILYDFLGLDGVSAEEALSTALWCVIRNVNIDPEVILRKGIFYGGDCDTIGALIGQMTGILFGQRALRMEWVTKLENYVYICSLVADLLLLK